MNKPIKLPKHIHIYRRVNIVPSWKSKLPETHKHYRPKREVFVCQAPLCKARLDINVAVGKVNECNVCHRPFILDNETVSRAKPRCRECIVRVKTPEVIDLTDYLNEKDI